MISYPPFFVHCAPPPPLGGGGTPNLHSFFGKQFLLRDLGGEWCPLNSSSILRAPLERWGNLSGLQNFCSQNRPNLSVFNTSCEDLDFVEESAKSRYWSSLLFYKIPKKWNDKMTHRKQKSNCRVLGLNCLKQSPFQRECNYA